MAYGYNLVRKIYSVLACVLLAIATPLWSYGQSGDDALRYSERFPGFTPSSFGMAGAGIASAHDASALILNPAGLALAKGSVFSGAWSTFKITEDARYSLTGRLSPSEADVTGSDLGNLSYLYKVPTARGSLVFSAAISQVNTFERNLYFEGSNNLNSITDYFLPLPGEFSIDDGSDGPVPVFSRTPSFIAFETFAIDFDQRLFNDGDPAPFLPAVSAGTINQIGTVTEEGRMHEVNVGAAFEASKGVMLGASINIPFGTYRFTRTFEEDDVNNDNDGLGGTTDFSYLRYTEGFTSDISGVNVRAGILAALSPRFSVGFTLETPTLLSITDNFDTRLQTEFDNGDVFVYGDDRDEQAGNGTFDYEITTPWHVGAGLSFKNKGFTASFDAELIDWSQLELDAKGFSFSEENRAISQQLDAVVNTRLGAEYDSGTFIVRAGLAVYPDPRDPTFARQSEGYVDRERTFGSLGFGYRFGGQFQADVGWMQEQFNDVYRPYTEVADAPLVQEEVTRNRFQIGLTYNFR